MPKRSLNTLPLGLVLATWCCAGLAAEDTTHWGYTGDIGPENWGELSEDFASCRVGRNQSPIDIRKQYIVKADLQPLILHYDVDTTEIVNNGHTLQVNVKPGAYLEAEGKRFELLQFHMHSPSEHKVEGENYPLEMHFVHRSEDGEFAVIGVLFKEGDHQVTVRHIQDVAPAKGETVPLQRPLTELVSKKEVPSYYRYDGSLTTPPCTEGLRWYIWPAAITVSKEQIDNYLKIIGEDARETQPINARFILFAE